MESFWLVILHCTWGSLIHAAHLSYLSWWLFWDVLSLDWSLTNHGIATCPSEVFYCAPPCLAVLLLLYDIRFLHIMPLPLAIHLCATTRWFTALNPFCSIWWPSLGVQRSWQHLSPWPQRSPVFPWILPRVGNATAAAEGTTDTNSEKYRKRMISWSSSLLMPNIV